MIDTLVIFMTVRSLGIFFSKSRSAMISENYLYFQRYQGGYFRLGYLGTKMSFVENAEVTFMLVNYFNWVYFFFFHGKIGFSWHCMHVNSVFGKKTPLYCALFQYISCIFTRNILIKFFAFKQQH